MTTTVPESHQDLLDAKYATLATAGPDGTPQVSEIWFLRDGDSVALSLNTARQKTKNMMARPQATLFILDLENPGRYLEIRGEAVITSDDDYEFADQLGAKYGADVRQMDKPGEKRVAIRLLPTRVNAVAMF